MNILEASNEDLKKIIEDIQKKIIEKEIELELKKQKLQELDNNK